MTLKNGSVFALVMLMAPAVMAQGIGGGMGMGYGGMGMGYGGMGYGGMGMGYGGMGMGYGAEGGPGAVVTAKYGEKIYDAVFGDLVDYKVYFIQVPADTIGVHYFDDGTHGDEVAFDGMPSNITINRDTYLGPFAIRYKTILKNAMEHAKEMGALEFYKLNVATENPDSIVTKLPDWEKQMKAEVLDTIASRLNQYEGLDDATYKKSIDPALFESMEGYGGLGGAGMGAGGLLPDLPPPPGLPNPLELNFGMPEGTPELDGTAPGSPMLPPAAPGESRQPAQPRVQRYNPVQNAQDTVDAVNTLNQ
ncbi:MAG: hypothetical protein ACE15F_09400 [bacterium]